MRLSQRKFQRIQANSHQVQCCHYHFCFHVFLGQMEFPHADFSMVGCSFCHQPSTVSKSGNNSHWPDTFSRKTRNVMSREGDTNTQTSLASFSSFHLPNSLTGFWINFKTMWLRNKEILYLCAYIDLGENIQDHEQKSKWTINISKLLISQKSKTNSILVRYPHWIFLFNVNKGTI